jgi:hypothetical protein
MVAGAIQRNNRKTGLAFRQILPKLPLGSIGGLWREWKLGTRSFFGEEIGRLRSSQPSMIEEVMASRMASNRAPY